MTLAHALDPETTFAVIGAGRLGAVFASALRAAEFAVEGPLHRGEDSPIVDVALLAVPDASIPDAAAAARVFASKIGHLSGATSLADVDFRIHPLQTFTGAESPEVFEGIGTAVAGRTPAEEALAAQIATALGARPFTVDDAHRTEYHAAASFASNFVLTVLDTAEQLAVASGIRNPRAVLAPLLRQTVDNWERDSAERALTGPIVRGDDATVALQRAAAVVHGHGELFDALAAATLEIAARATHPVVNAPEMTPTRAAQHPIAERKTSV